MWRDQEYHKEHQQPEGSPESAGTVADAIINDDVDANDARTTLHGVQQEHDNTETPTILWISFFRTLRLINSNLHTKFIHN